MKRIVLVVLAGLGIATPLAAPANSRAALPTAFAGSWIIVDDRARTSGTPCQLILSAVAEGGLVVATAACDAQTASVTAWSIADEQLVLLAGDTPLVRLGGSPGRLSGSTESGRAFILERPTEGLLEPSLAAALERAGCFFLGYSARCATDEDLAAPAAAEPGAQFGLTLLVKLNVRTEPRSDAPILGVAEEAACIVADQCVLATDGSWCRADFGGVEGWFRRHTLRQSYWPVITFEAGCTSGAVGD